MSSSSLFVAVRPTVAALAVGLAVLLITAGPAPAYPALEGVPQVCHVTTGTPGNDVLYAAPGKSCNEVFGLGGNDVIFGSSGVDYIYGGGGADRIYGGGGADVLWGGYGHDFLHGGSGADQMFGFAGDDVFDAFDGSLADSVHGNLGNDCALVDIAVTSEGPNTEAAAAEVVFSAYFPADVGACMGWAGRRASALPVRGCKPARRSCIALETVLSEGAT